MTKTFLITGGAGFLGINLARHLLAKNERVISYDLAPFDYSDCKDRVTDIRGDIRNLEQLNAAMRGVDVVVHTAAALPLYKPEDIYTTDVDGTRAVLQAAKQNNVERVIHISSTAVYGIPDHHPLLETDKMVGVGPYGEAKVTAEKVVQEFRAQGMCIPVLRPKSFIGPERLGVFAMLYEWAYEGKNFPVLGSGNNPYQYLAVQDLCDAIYAVATLPRETVNDTFNVGAKIYGTPKTDFQAVLDRAGHGKKIISIPEAPAILALKVLSAVGLSPLYPWVYETVGKESFVSIEKASKTFGFNPKFSNQDALIENYDWYVANLNKFKNASGVSHRVPWKQGALSLAKIFF
ncbi:MAG: epimerase [Chloroflexi bacterium UTCFX4]|nr:MAG: epimerase [Chloroflexi bacterium UTCFX4]